MSPNTVGASFSSLFHNIRIRTSQNTSVFLRLVKEKLSLHVKKSVKLGVVNLSMSNLDKIEEIEIYT